MLLVTFPTDLGNDLEIVSKISTIELFNDFVTLAIDAINGKTAPAKVYNKASQQLGTEPVVIEKCIKGLGLLLINCAKKNATIPQFTSAIAEFGFNEEQLTILTKQYEQYHYALRSTLHQQTKIGTHLESFDWRLDVEIASRSCRNIFTPTYVCQLTTKSESEGKLSSEIVQCDYSVLNLIHDQLSIAVNESKTPHARRIQKYVK